jgi:hypothetical protein
VDILVNNAGWNIGIPFKNLDALTPRRRPSLAEPQARTTSPRKPWRFAGRIPSPAKFSLLTAACRLA